MAGPDPGPAVPVWLAEDDLGCIICHGLLAWPATLPCGHSFCRDCLKGLWAAGCAGPPRSCPTCRASAAEPRQLRKNTMLQELVDKYSRALREVGEGPAGAAGTCAPRRPAPQPPRAPPAPPAADRASRVPCLRACALRPAACLPGDLLSLRALPLLGKWG
uniref:RING-type domain-containing protein n=1 Tax=Canis lupus dingo TaxID=286419 RepID=A0A8C0KQC5_CANLU